MKIKNDLVRIKVGKKKYDFHNLILNEYLRRFALGQTDKENATSRNVYQIRDLNYILLKFDTPISELNENSEISNYDFDICIINRAKYSQNLSEKNVIVQYSYECKKNDSVLDEVIASQGGDSSTGAIKYLKEFYGRKIMAIGFSGHWWYKDPTPVCAVLDTSNYNIYLEENQEFSVTRRDIITTDAEFYSNDKDKVPAPVHLAPYGVPQIINQPDIVDSEGTINSFYDNAYGALYSIGKGYMPNVIEEEKIIGEDAKVVNNGTSLTISSVENEDVGTEALYPSEDLYPIGKFVEEIQTSEKGIQVSLEGNEEDAFVQIDGKSTQATRSGKNLFDASKIANTAIEVLDNGKTIKMPIVTEGNGYTNTLTKLSVLCPNLNVGDTVYLFFKKSDENYNQYIYLDGSSFLWNRNTARTITQDDLSGTVALYGNRYSEGQTEQITIIDFIITKENNNEWEQYGASPSPEFPSEIKSVGDDVNILDITTKNVHPKLSTEIIDKELIIKREASGGGYVSFIKEGLKIGENYTIKSNSSIYIYKDAVYGTLYKNTNDASEGYTFTAEQESYIIAIIIGSADIPNIGDQLNCGKIKLQKGTVATPYSEYGKGTLNIEQSSSNLFNASKITNTTISVLDSGKTIKMPIDTSGNGYTHVGTNLKGVCPKLKVGDTVYLLGDTTSQKNKFIYLGGNSKFTWEFGKSKTLTENDLNAAFVLYGNNFEKGETEQVTISNLRIVKNASDKWEQYFNNTYTIPLSEPLRSLPNGVKDTLEADGIHRRVGKFLLDGSEDWRIRTDYSYENYTVFRNGSYNGATYKLITNGYGLSNYFNIMQSQVEENNIRFINTNAYGTQITISNDIASTVEEFKTWLSTHNTEVLYELSKEVVEPFTEEQLEVINSIETQKGTNIFSVNNELNPEIQVTEYKSPLYPIKDNYKYIILKYKVWQEVVTGEYTEEDGYIQEITDTGYYYHQAIPLEEYGILNTTIKYERG